MIEIMLSVWDIGGQERFDAIKKEFFEGTTAAVLVFDLARLDSFNKLNFYLKEARESTGNSGNIPIFLVGNKTDLGEIIEISAEQINTWMRVNEITDFMKTSAKTGENIEEMFTKLSKMTLIDLQKSNLKLGQLRKDGIFQFKVVLVGAAGVGKTSIIHRFAENNFQEQYSLTIGVDFLTKKMQLEEDMLPEEVLERIRTINPPLPSRVSPSPPEKTHPPGASPPPSPKKKFLIGRKSPTPPPKPSFARKKGLKKSGISSISFDKITEEIADEITEKYAKGKPSETEDDLIIAPSTILAKEDLKTESEESAIIEGEKDKSTLEQTTILKRKTTVFYQRQMNPLTHNKLSVILSTEKIFEQLKKRIAETRASSDKTLKIKEISPFVEVQPVFPSCVIVPAMIPLDARKDSDEAKFDITPLATGEIKEACVKLYYEGELIDNIPTPTRVVKQTAAKISGFLAFFLSLFSNYLNDIIEKWFQFIPGMGTYIEVDQILLLLSGISAIISAISYYLKKSKKAKPVYATFPSLDVLLEEIKIKTVISKII
ncbi:MAG: GTP-binding protein [Promethearchaeota archaeon]